MLTKKTTRWSRWGLPAFLAVAVVTSGNLYAQDEEELEAFTVTGTLLRGTDVQTTTPITTITAADIERSGRQQISDLIRNLPLNSGISEADATASFAADGAYVNLRGIGPNATLVLVDGRRMAPYGAADFRGRGFVDLNSIPPSAIERIDVVRVGASAIYGSDALAGAINIVLRKDFEGLELRGFYGNTFGQGHDVGTVNLSATMGTTTARGNIVVISNYFRRNELRLADLPYAEIGYAGEAFDFGDFGLPFEFLRATRAQNRAGFLEGFFQSTATYPARFDAIGGTAAGGVEYRPGYWFAGDGSDAHNAAWDAANFNDHITAWTAAERKGAFVIGRYDITDTIEAFTQINYQSNVGRSQFAPAPSFGDFNIPAENPYNPTNPANTAFYRPEIFTRVGLDPNNFPQGLDLNMTFRPTDPGNRLFETYSDTFRFVGGVTVDIPDFRMEIEPSFVYVENRLEDVTRNLLVAELVQDALNNTETSATTPDPNQWALNPFVIGPNVSDNELIYNELVKADNTRNARSDLSLWRLLARGELLDLPSGELSYAVGLEYREENLEDRPSLASMQGQLIGSGGASSAGSRSAWAAYAEVGAPIIDEVSVQAAVRFEDYDDFGDTGFKPQFGVRVQPFEDLTARFAFSRNFKAPSLSQAYAGLQRGFLGREDRVRFPITQDPFDSSGQQKEIRTGGNPQLQPEESDTFSLVINYSPSFFEGLDLEVGLWRVRVSELIDTLPLGQIEADEFALWQEDNAAFLAMDPIQRGNQTGVFRGPNEVFQGQTIPGPIDYINQVYLNLESVKTQGIDFDVRYRMTTDDMGDFTFGVAATYIDEYIVDGGANQAGDFRRPKWRGTGTVSWQRGDWAAALNAYYIHRYADLDVWENVDFDPATEARPDSVNISSWTTVDLRVTYGGFWGMDITVGVDNVFDRDPPLYRNDNTFYDPAFHNPLGRFSWIALKRAF